MSYNSLTRQRTILNENDEVMFNEPDEPTMILPDDESDNKNVERLQHRLEILNIEEAQALGVINRERARVWEQIGEIHARQQGVGERTRSKDDEIRVGSRVCITNKRNKGHSATAVVTTIEGDKISFRMDNGHNTWRLRHNLRKLA